MNFSLRDIEKREAWAALMPALHIENDALLHTAALPFGGEYCARLRDDLRTEGYCQANENNWAIACDKLAKAVRDLVGAGLSPVFAFLYDEFWLSFRQIDPLLRELIGPYAMLPDFWVWNVDPAQGQAGWTPHRDKGHVTLRADGTPNSVTVWIPLTDATPLNSCMYIVPANRDPTYGTAQEGLWRFELPDIRALPAKPGDVLVWNQAVLHWGSRSAPDGGASRVSMAVEFQRVDVPPMNPPLIKPLAPLPFAARLSLIAKQTLQYRHMYAMAPEMEQAMTRIAQNGP